MSDGTIKYAGFSGDLEKADCPTCGQDANRSLLFKEGEIGFYSCANCSLQFASPRFTEAAMLKIYGDEHFTHDYKEFRSWTYEEWVEKGDRSYIVSKKKIELIQEYLPERSRILDVGCSIGLTVLLANKQGFEAEGVELSKELFRIATEIIGTKVSNQELKGFKNEKLYQGIVIWDVLEHLYDPVDVLRDCVSRMEPGGYLFAQIPNHRGIGNRTKQFLCQLGLRSTFKHFGFPWHVYSFDKKSLIAMLEKVGLRAIRFESWPSALMDNKSDPLSKLSIYLAKKFTKTDYIMVVAQK